MNSTTNSTGINYDDEDMTEVALEEPITNKKRSLELESISSNKRPKIKKKFLKQEFIKSVNKIIEEFILLNTFFFRKRPDLLNDLNQIISNLETKTIQQVLSSIDNYKLQTQDVSVLLHQHEMDNYEYLINEVFSDINQALENYNKSVDLNTAIKVYVRDNYDLSYNTSSVENKTFKKVFEKMNTIFEKYQNNQEITLQELYEVNNIIFAIMRRYSDGYISDDEPGFSKLYEIKYFNEDEIKQGSNESKEYKKMLEEIINIIKDENKTFLIKYEEVRNRGINLRTFYKLNRTKLDLAFIIMNSRIWLLPDLNILVSKKLDYACLEKIKNVAENFFFDEEKIKKFSSVFDLNPSIENQIFTYNLNEVKQFQGTCINNFTDSSQVKFEEKFEKEYKILQDTDDSQYTIPDFLRKQYEFMRNLGKEEIKAIYYYTSGNFSKSFNLVLRDECQFDDLHEFQKRMFRLLIEIYIKVPRVEIAFKVYRGFPWSKITNTIFNSTSTNPDTAKQFILIGASANNIPSVNILIPNTKPNCCYHVINVLPGAKVLFFPSSLNAITEYEESEILFPPDITNKKILQQLGFQDSLRFGQYHKIHSLLDDNMQKHIYIYEPYDNRRYIYTDRTIRNVWKEQEYGPLVLSFGNFVKKYNNKKDKYSKALKYFKALTLTLQ